MTRKFNVLQIGNKNYMNNFEHLTDVAWDFFDAQLLNQDAFNLESVKLFLDERKYYDFVLVQTAYSQNLIKVLEFITYPFNTYIDDYYWDLKFECASITSQKNIRKLLYYGEKDLIERLKFITFPGQYGDKIYPSHCIIDPNFTGEVLFLGKSKIKLEGEFGNVLHPIISWKSNLISDANKVVEIRPDFFIEGNIEIEYTFRVIESGSLDNIIQEIRVSNLDLDKPVLIKGTSQNNYIAVSIKAKGQGSINIGPVHKRWSRLDMGQFILGGKKYTDENRDEFIYYLNPGNMKPPLNVYFSGYRTAEGFEGYNMMNKFEHPFLLIGDPRVEGGSFYIGSKNFEQAILDTIQKALKELDFKAHELILSGLSMGSYAALYYGVQLSPTAIIVGKPLVNIGTIADNMKLVRPNDFGTALDVLLNQTGGNSPRDIKKMNDKFWNKLKENNFEKTTFAISYMENDDYDVNAFEELLPILNKNNAKVISRGIPGRHNDDSPTITNWFVNFYKITLENEFRGVINEK